MSQIGWRAWLTDKTGALIAFNGEVWPPEDPLKAECRVWYNPVYGPSNPVGHKAPHIDCGCGIYVFKWAEDVEGLIHTPGYNRSCVIGCVEWWGDYWEHSLGYRVEYAIPRALHVVRGRLHPVYHHLVDRRQTWEQLVSRWEKPEEDHA